MARRNKLLDEIQRRIDSEEQEKDRADQKIKLLTDLRDSLLPLVRKKAAKTKIAPPAPDKT